MVEPVSDGTQGGGWPQGAASASGGGGAPGATPSVVGPGPGGVRIGPGGEPDGRRSSRRGVWLVAVLGAAVVLGTALVILIIGIAIALSRSPTPSGVTFTVSVDAASWAKAQAFVAGPENDGAYSSAAELIFSFLCEDGDTKSLWLAPIPTQTGQTAAGRTFTVHLTGSEVARGEQELKSLACDSQLGLKTVQDDYRSAATPYGIGLALAAAAPTSATTPSTHPGPTSTSQAP